MQKLAAALIASVVLGMGFWAPDAVSLAEASATDQEAPPASDDVVVPEDVEPDSGAGDADPNPPDDDDCDPGGADALFATSWQQPPRAAS